LLLLLLFSSASHQAWVVVLVLLRQKDVKLRRDARGPPQQGNFDIPAVFNINLKLSRKKPPLQRNASCHDGALGE
jgi:hypothetical protein